MEKPRFRFDRPGLFTLHKYRCAGAPEKFSWLTKSWTVMRYQSFWAQLLTISFFFATLLSLTAQAASANVRCAWLFSTSHSIESRQNVSKTLTDAVSTRANKRYVGVIEVEGIAVPRVSKHSKWRALVLVPSKDRTDIVGHLSGFDRNGQNVEEHRKSKFNEATGRVRYQFGDGRTVIVSAQTARALEFSYLDRANPKSPRNAKSIGIHDDLARVIRMARQAKADILGTPGAYIRIDEIATEGLSLTSAERLYNEFNLHNPNYSPKGEWISDGSIPARNITSTFKFQAVHGIEGEAALRAKSLRVGDLVNYTAITGQRYLGRIARNDIVDGYAILTYPDGRGGILYDIGLLEHIQLHQPQPR